MNTVTLWLLIAVGHHTTFDHPASQTHVVERFVDRHDCEALRGVITATARNVRGDRPPLLVCTQQKVWRP